MVIMVNYDLFAGTFSNSRKNLKWEEIEYFLTSFLFEHSPLTPLLKGEGKRVLDVGCGNGRLLKFLEEFGGKSSPLIKGVRGILNQDMKFIPYNADLKEKSRELRKNMTEAEKKIWYKYFRNIDIKVLRQKPLLNYIVDFYIPEILLVVEIDGDSHYEQEAIGYDERRTKELNLYGLEVLRFTNSDIYNNFDGVCETIEEKIRNRENPPNPLYQGGNREIPLAPFIKGGYSYLGIDSSAELLKEARKLYPEREFLNLDMLSLEKIKSKFDVIFFVASFHHLENVEDRRKVLKQAYDLLDENGLAFMTNWALESEFNREKYKNSKIPNSTNEFGSSDFNIKIGEFSRFYHCFTLKELEYLFKEVGFEVVENREFEGGKNFVSVLRKK